MRENGGPLSHLHIIDDGRAMAGAMEVDRATLVYLIEQALDQKLEVFKLRLMEDVTDLVIRRLRE